MNYMTESQLKTLLALIDTMKELSLVQHSEIVLMINKLKNGEDIK